MNFLIDGLISSLLEHPHYQASMITEKHIKNSVQALQQDFQSNPKLQMFSLM